MSHLVSTVSGHFRRRTPPRPSRVRYTRIWRWWSVTRILPSGVQAWEWTGSLAEKICNQTMGSVPHGPSYTSALAAASVAAPALAAASPKKRPPHTSTSYTLNDPSSPAIEKQL